MLHARLALCCRGFAIAMVILTFTASSPAAVIYSEPIDGDLPSFFPEAPILPMGPGDNVIFGEIIPPDPDPADAFKFEVLLDQILDEIILELDAPSPVDVEIELRELIDDITEEILRVFVIEAPTPEPVKLSELTPVVGPPLDDLSGGIHGMRMKTIDDPSYTITLVIIPEPGTAFLLGIAGLTVLCLRRRRVA